MLCIKLLFWAFDTEMVRLVNETFDTIYFYVFLMFRSQRDNRSSNVFGSKMSGFFKKK